MKNAWVTIILLVLLVGVSLGFAYYYGTQQGKSGAATTASEQAMDTVDMPLEDAVPSETAPSVQPTEGSKSSVPAGWMTYTNSQYGFSISYPSSYKALTDSDNLYGWPDAIVLIYGGGQSYDLAIEHWDSQADYEAKYQNQSNITVKKVGNQYITLLNMNFEPEVDEMIKTFTIL